MRTLAITAATLLVVVAAAVLGWRRWGPAPVTAEGQVAPRTDAAVPTPSESPSQAPAVLLAAGDIADCGDGAKMTGQLLRDQPGIVAALGDLAYPDGSAGAFADCYDPAWGPFRDRTRPAQGNHDVRTRGARAYHAYFGSTAGPEPQGYYSYDLGAWHVVVLNSNCAQAGGCGPDSPQVDWLRDDLTASGRTNILAYWHVPRFSTGAHGDNTAMATFWQVLTDAGADVVLNGHDHDYERSAPMAPDGTADPDGIRQFVVGTGGAPLRDFRSTRATVQSREHDQHGILRLDLRACGYRWAFLAVNGNALDRGATTGTC